MENATQVRLVYGTYDVTADNVRDGLRYFVSVAPLVILALCLCSCIAALVGGIVRSLCCALCCGACGPAQADYELPVLNARPKKNKDIVRWLIDEI